MQTKGLTLTELLIASILIGIVMLGVASFSVVVRNIQNTTDKSTQLAMETALVMNYLTKNATLAIGHQGNPGIIPDTQEADPTQRQWISFRQDLNSTPRDYSDDTWVIFLKTAGDYRLYECRQTETQGGPTPDITGQCDPLGSKAVVLSDQIYSTSFDFVTDSSTNTFYVDIGIQTRWDLNPEVPLDPITNPALTLQTRVSPPAHSWD